ncbi:MAG: S41 family peptidase [Candidatus Cloacimonetes bacterium]|nr:S41 family peptidase [Candidatus Cloacimonadota bacterium]
MKLKKTGKIFLTLGISGWILIGVLLLTATRVDAKDNGRDTMFKKMELFNQVLYNLQKNYVDTLYVDDMIEAAINGMLDELDPHTTFFDPDEFEKFNTNTKGEFGGLGISINQIGDYITVVSPIEGTPAYKMGIMAGDKIVKVDGTSVVGMSTDDAIKQMRGDKGSKVLITIKRPGVKEELDFEIIRDIIKIDSVPYAFVMDNGIGYLRIRQFNANTTQELSDNLNKLEKEGIRGLIIDLRFNPGGLLTEAVNTVNEFIGKDKRVVFTQGKLPEANQEYFTRYNRMRSGYPVVVMINEASASASEIFAGSMQDYDRALVVGKTSYGKGSVQRLFKLSDEYGIKITTAKYYINSGRCIHKDLNDTLLKDPRVRYGDISEEELDKMRAEADKEHLKDIHYTEKGRTVYGGGGINPDLTIEQAKMTRLGMELRRKNLTFNFAVDYMIKNEDKVELGFQVDDKIFNDFMQFAQEDSVEWTDTQLDSTMSWIKNNLTSNIINKKFGDEEGYKVAIQDDQQLQEAVAIFDKCPTLDDMFSYAAEQQAKKEE